MKRFFTWLILIPLASVLLAGACSTEDDVIAIRKLISEGVRLGEEQDIGGLIKLTTDDYEAHPGNLDRRGVKRVLWLAFNRYGKFHILHPRPKVTLESDGRSAFASFPFLILKEDTSIPKLQKLYEEPQRWLEEVGKRADLYHLKFDLVKAESDWLVKRTHLESFNRLSFNE